jgi:hypothetical protein
MPYSNFHAVRKYIHEDGYEERMRDEPWTADEWWDLEVDIWFQFCQPMLMMHMQSELPDNTQLEHCLAPLHIFLDEGRVSTRMNMHPIVLRALWLNSEVWNGSGNGGGIIIGFMPMVSQVMRFL